MSTGPVGAAGSPSPAGADDPASMASVAHLFVDDLDDPRLAPDDEHHLLRVLRARPGEVVTVGDGKGGWRRAVVTGDARAVEAGGPVVHSPVPSPAVTIGVPPLKGDRLDWVVQKLTEIGADRVVIVAAARAVVRWDDAAAEKHVGRLRRIARAAAMQSRRAWLPSVEGVVGLGEAVGAGAALADRGGRPPSLERPFVVVGPEGGWERAERSLVPVAVGLGPRVLRAETAALVAGTLLTARRWEWSATTQRGKNGEHTGASAAGGGRDIRRDAGEEPL